MKQALQIYLFAILFTGSILLAAPANVLSFSSDEFSKEEVQEIRTALGISFGQRVDLAKMDQGVRNLSGSGRYLRLSIAALIGDGGYHIKVKGARLRRIRRLSFRGGEEEIIEEARARLSMQEGSNADFRALEELKASIQSLYQTRGYHLAEVMLVTRRVPDSDDIDVELAVVPNTPTTISKVQVLGGSSEENQFLQDLIPLRRGSRLTNEGVEKSREAITRYFSDNQFPTSRVEEIGIVFTETKLKAEITIRVKMGERFLFVFDGNVQFSDLVLREFITSDLISQVDFGRIIADEVRKKYQSAGFHFCNVTYKFTKDPISRVNQVRFAIDEGYRVRIDRVEFLGGEPLSDGILKELMLEDAPGVLKRGVYWEAGASEMMTRFQKRLQKLGFLNPSITGPRTVYSEDKKGVILIIDARLGVQSKISRVELAGNKALSNEELQNALSVEVGEPVDMEKVTGDRKTIIEKYKRAGYADVKVTEGPKVLQLASDQREGVVKFEIEEGPKYSVGTIIVEGNQKTKPHVILRELTLKSGDAFSEYEVSRSQENLFLLSIFSRVEILTETSIDSPHTKNIRVVVAELKGGNGEVGMGGTYEDPRIRWINFLSLAYKNIGGINHTASSRAELRVPFSYKGDKLIPFLEYGVVLGYSAPYPFELPVNFAAQAGLDGYEISTDPDGATSTLQYRARIQEKLEKRLSSHFLARYHLHRFERTTVEKKAFVPQSSPLPDKITNNIGSTGPGFEVDFRDDVFNPTRGTYHVFDLEFAHPYLLSDQKVFFALASLRNSFYFPIISPFSFAMYLGATWAHSFNRDSGQSLGDRAIPLARRTNELSLGGLSSIRGFSPKRVTPTADAAEVALYNARFELSVGLFENISGAIFFDTGQVFSATADESLELRTFPDGRGKRYDGVGIGFRYKTAVGPILIDIAQGLGEDKENVKFSFTVGRF